MRTFRLLFRLSGILLILLGFNSCDKKSKKESDKDCDGELISCTYMEDYGEVTMYFCQDGWYSYQYQNGQEYVYFESDISSYWSYYRNMLLNAEEVDCSVVD